MARPWDSISTDTTGSKTMAEALEKASANFQVSKVPVAAVLGDGESAKYSVIPESFATVRADTGQVVGTVGSKYEIIQNADAFSFFDIILDEGEASIERVGVKDGGRLVWAMAKMPKKVTIMEGDKLSRYLLILTTHDGTKCVQVAITPIRVICQNTLQAALRGAAATINIRHTISHKKRLEEARKVIEASKHYWDVAKKTFRSMAEQDFSDEQMVSFVEVMFPSKSQGERRTKTDGVRESIMNLWHTGQGVEIAGGTKWGAWNAVTEWIDYNRKLRSATNAWEASVFGNGAQIRQKALEVLLAN